MAFDAIPRGKMEQLLLAYGFPKETVKAIIKTQKSKFNHPVETQTSLILLLKFCKDIHWYHISL